MKSKILRKTFLSLCVILGLATVAHAQNLYVSVNGPLGSSGGSISEYTPTGTQITFASSLEQPRGLAFDSSGNLFAGLTFSNPAPQHAKIFKFPPRKHESVLGNAAHSFTQGVVTDGAGNVFALVQDGDFPIPCTIYKFAPDGTRTLFGSTPGQSFAIAFDNNGNLFAADAVNATIWKFTPDGTRTVFVGPSAFADETFPVGLAFDIAGNLFVSTEGDPGNDTILVFTPDGMESTFATGLTQPRGLAFDASGNLFVAETRPAPLGDIVEFPTGGSEIVFATGIDRPEYLTFGPAR
jgi:sugar lactone lactonase YvrE